MNDRLLWSVFTSFACNHAPRVLPIYWTERPGAWKTAVPGPAHVAAPAVAGFLQIGNPFFYNSDPVCFDCNSPRIEKRIVQLDHEAILQQGQMTVAKEIAPSFVDFLHAAVR